MTDGRLRVGLNLLFLHDRSGGVGRLVTELLGALAVRDDLKLDVFLHADAPDEIRQVAGAERVRYTQLPVHRPGSKRYMAAEYVALPALAVARRLDVLHSPANAGPVKIPGVACAVSLHDTIWRHAKDDWGPPEAQRAMERISVPTVRRADRVLTGSEHSAADVAEQLGIARSRIAVVSNGVRFNPDAPATPEAELRERLALGNAPVLLCVAQKRPYKNHESLVRALAAIDDRESILVMPGAPTGYEDRLRSLAAELGVADRIRLPDWVSDEELEGLYALAIAMLLPSRLEGFGLPVLEAMGRGLPVLCSSTTSLGDVAGDAALLIDPDDQAAITAGVQRLLAEPQLRAELAAAGRARAAQFTWARVAELTVGAYREAIAARKA